MPSIKTNKRSREMLIAMVRDGVTAEAITAAAQDLLDGRRAKQREYMRAYRASEKYQRSKDELRAKKNQRRGRSVAGVARRLGCSRWTALRTMKNEGATMGAECLYKTDTGRRVWRIMDPKTFERWLANRRAPYVSFKP